MRAVLKAWCYASGAATAVVAFVYACDFLEDQWFALLDRQGC